METLPGKFKEALEGIRDIERLASQKYQEQQLRAEKEGAHPDIVGGVKPSTKPGFWVECRGFEPVFRRRMAALGVPMYAFCVWRSDDEQAKELAEGDSDAGPGQSPHQFGCAVDMIHSVKGWGLNGQQWAVSGHVGKEVAKSLGLNIVWGGDWSDPWDPAHFELRDWRIVRGVFQSDPAIRTVPQALDVLAAERSQV